MSNSYASIEDVKEKLDIDHPLDIHTIYKLKKKRLAQISRQQDPEVRKRRNETERIRKATKRKEDPQYYEKTNAYARVRYAKNPEPQKSASTKWNQKNKERRNTNQRANYAKNRDKICKRIREKRRLKRESKE